LDITLIFVIIQPYHTISLYPQPQQNQFIKAEAPSSPEVGGHGHVFGARTWPFPQTDNHTYTHISYIDWIGLRENLQETIDFPIKYGVFL